MCIAQEKILDAISKMKVEKIVINNGTININERCNLAGSETKQTKKVKVEILKQCAEKVKHLFWEPCAITVVYCIGRDLYDYKKSYSQFERDFRCSAKIISRTITNNPYMSKHVNEWDELNVPSRVQVLKKAFIAEVEAVTKSQEYVETT